MLLRVVPTQGEQDFLALSRSPQGGFSDELPIRLKENRYTELLRAVNSLNNQERLHFQAMTCDAVVIFQGELLSRASGSDLESPESPGTGRPGLRDRTRRRGRPQGSRWRQLRLHSGIQCWRKL